MWSRARGKCSLPPRLRQDGGMAVPCGLVVTSAGSAAVVSRLQPPSPVGNASLNRYDDRTVLALRLGAF
jgi:hypothetical protein